MYKMLVNTKHIWLVHAIFLVFFVYIHVLDSSRGRRQQTKVRAGEGALLAEICENLQSS